MKFLYFALLFIGVAVEGDKIVFPNENILTVNVSEQHLSEQNITEQTKGLSINYVKVIYFLHHLQNIISHGVMKFALDLDYVIDNTEHIHIDNVEKEKNLIFSPLNIAGTLALILMSSGGQTFNEVANLLDLQSEKDILYHSEFLHQVFSILTSKMQSDANYASGIFLQTKFRIRPEFQNMCENVYNCEIIKLDFQNYPEHAKNIINNWVHENTFGKIPSILDKSPSVFTKVILASALYFNGKWEQPFLEFDTKRNRFFIERGKSVETELMTSTGNFPYYGDENLGVQIVGLPYEGRKVFMYILLTTTEGAAALRNFKLSLTSEIIENLIDKTRNVTCTVAIPKMKLTNSFNLKGALMDLGLSSLFDPENADLSMLSSGPQRSIRELNRRTRKNQIIHKELLESVKSRFNKYGLDDLRNSHRAVNPRLYVEDILHKVTININEEGTEAGAATAGGIDRSLDQNFIVANRPFLFFIRHETSKLIWFWGTINNPKSPV